METLAWIGIVLVLLTALIVGWYLQHRRRQALAHFALANGLEFSSRDPFHLAGLPFSLFRKGDRRTAENVMWGTWQDRAVTAFDYSYQVESSSSDGGTTRTTYRFSCVALELPVPLPELRITPEGFLSRLADRVGLRDLQFESEEFNRRFQVTAPIARFAYELVDARMMRWLLSLTRGYALEIQGDRVLLWLRRLRPEQLPAMLGAATVFHKRIPQVVWGLYGGGSPTVTG